MISEAVSRPMGRLSVSRRQALVWTEWMMIKTFAAGLGLLATGVLTQVAAADQPARSASGTPCAAAAGGGAPWIGQAPQRRMPGRPADRAAPDAGGQARRLGRKRPGRLRSQRSARLGYVPQGPPTSPAGRQPAQSAHGLRRFDVGLAYDYGAAVGREFRFGGVTRSLGPTVDIARTWRMGQFGKSG